MGVVVLVLVVVMVVEVVALHGLHPFPPPAYLQFFAPALAAEAESTALEIPEFEGHWVPMMTQYKYTQSSKVFSESRKKFSQIEIELLIYLFVYIFLTNLVGLFSHKKKHEQKFLSSHSWGFNW